MELLNVFFILTTVCVKLLGLYLPLGPIYVLLYEGKCKWSYGPSCPMVFSIKYIRSFIHYYNFWHTFVFCSVTRTVDLSAYRSTASRSPVLTRGSICVPPTVTYLPYRVSVSTLTAVGRSQLLPRTQRAVQTQFKEWWGVTQFHSHGWLKAYLFARY